MYRIIHILILTLCPLVTFSQDLKFELLAKWENLTPEFPIGFGSDYNAIDIFNIGDFNNDGVPDVGFKTASYSSSNPYDSLYILTLNKNGSVNNLYPIVPGVSGFDYVGERSSGWGGFGAGLVNLGDLDENGVNDFLISSPSEKINDKILFDDLSFILPAGGIVGIIGPNGAGKSTLFKLITGIEKPSKGEVILGDTVNLSYVDQSRDDLNSTNTVWEEISGGQEIVKLGELDVNSRAYCSSFNFRGVDQQKSMSKLSGGERNRVHIAKMLKSGGNVLMLDEPTNDLDVETLSALEYAISEFAGSAMVISHDRFFLNRICTHILAFEGDSHVEWFEGDFDTYIKDKKRRLGEEAVNPKRTKYRKFLV